MEIDQELLDLRLKGYCCSQIIMELGLRRMDKTNEDLIASMAGLCDGMWTDKTCGILSASICLLYLADADAAARGNVQELCEWFETSFESDQCKDLIGDNPLKKIELCPMMLESTFMKVSELLEWDE